MRTRIFPKIFLYGLSSLLLTRNSSENILRTPMTIFRYSIFILLAATIIPYVCSKSNPTLQLKANASEIPIKPYPIVSFDLYTQRGGTGPGIPGGEFEPGENVIFCVSMTSNGLPMENTTIAFNIESPANSFLPTAVTNSSGIASITFMIPPSDLAQGKILGTWSVTAQTGLDMDTVGDSLTFEIAPIMHAPESPVLTVLLMAFILTTAIAIVLGRRAC